MKFSKISFFLVFFTSCMASASFQMQTVESTTHQIIKSVVAPLIVGGVTYAYNLPTGICVACTAVAATNGYDLFLVKTQLGNQIRNLAQNR